VDLRKYAVMFVIAVLYTVFIFSSIDAVYPNPEYDDFCSNSRMAYPLDKTGGCENITEPSNVEREQCYESKGDVSYDYDGNGCPVSWKCDTCNNEYTLASKDHGSKSFFIATILGVVGVLIGLFLPDKKSINEWIGTGLMIGGLFCIFVATMMYYNDLDRILRPFIILAELLLVIYLAYRKLKN